MATEQQCVRAIEKHADEFERRARDNFVGVGIQPLLEDAPKGGEFVVAIYVQRKLPESELDVEDIMPKHVRVRAGGRTVTVRTRVIEQGEVTLEGPGG